MKKIGALFVAVSLLFVLITTSVFALMPLANGEYESDMLVLGSQSLPAIVIYADTPNTTDGVRGLYVLEELGDSLLTAAIQEFSSFPVTLLDSATATYNCHWYAWCRPSAPDLHLWVDDPSMFYKDGSYCEVSTPQVGDIICYFDDKGTATTSDDFNVHSGVVTAVSNGNSNGLCGNSDLVTVTSKWGYGGLYSHNGYVCPYTSYYSTGKADYVKYYRLHSVNYTDLGLLEGHRGICHGCGYYVEEGHDWSEMASFYMCRKCGHKSSHIPVAPNNIPEDILLKIQQKATLNEFAIDVDENTVLCYIDGQYYMVKGHTTDNALSYIKSASVVK